MMYNIQEYWILDFVLRMVFQRIQRYGNWTEGSLPTPHLMTEMDPVSETLCSLEYLT
jgi:hypothetical protein